MRVGWWKGVASEARSHTINWNYVNDLDWLGLQEILHSSLSTPIMHTNYFFLLHRPTSKPFHFF